MISAIIQAREDSSRLPNKVLKKIVNNENSISLIIKRLNKSKYIKKIIVAVPNKSKKFDYLKKKFKNIELFKGKKHNVLDRYYKAAFFFNITTIVRITSDCPLIDYKLLDKKNIMFIKENGFKVYPWTVNDMDKFNSLIEMGVDGIITDFPNLVR